MSDEKIFISYRRADSPGFARLLFDRLSARFGEENIFMDVEGLAPGVDFVEALEKAVGSCDVLITLIGKQWLTVMDDKGQRRLDNPEDFVRLEIAAALERNIRVIPILVQNARMPGSRDLPPVLKHLPRFERRTVLVMGVVSVTAVLLAVLSVTGWLNRIIYRPLETTWVDVPAGEFLMGGDADEALAICQQLYEPFTDSECQRDWFTGEELAHTVYLETYQIETYEVTNWQYAQCVKNGACQGGDYTYEDEAGNILNHLDDPAYNDHPVVGVDWFQSQTYCEWSGARLPTEAEWEKAARGTDSRIYPWGDEFDGNRANFCDTNCEYDWKNTGFDDGYTRTAPVGTYPQGVSPYGVYDMAGNVWEWTADWYNVYPGGNPEASDYFGEERRVLRGGSWDYNGDYLRSAYRGSNAPSNTVNDIGFRCARSP